MTARTTPLWQQILLDKLANLHMSPSLFDVDWHKNRTLGFVDGVWAVGAISDNEQENLRTSIQTAADKRRLELKKQGVKA